MEDKFFSPYGSYACITYADGSVSEAMKLLSEEVKWELIVHGEHIDYILSSPHELETLAIGYCMTHEIAKTGQWLHAVHGDGIVSVSIEKETTEDREPEGRPMSISAKRLCSYGNLLDKLSAAHHTTHGIHEGALVQDGTVLAYAEDISRNHVLNRLAGEIYLHHIDVSQTVLVFSGRVSTFVVETAGILHIPCIAARAMATSRAVSRAEELGITLVCALRSESFCVFSHKERLIEFL